uniref:ATP synthase F0 subunit 6 n=1 Tax=Praya dubia TaxID=316184 RepID=UPI0026E3660C|nr:ATP synthase F0 subunit 6 [Praya dubia]WJJ70094.1 ATP synthase F0 subunit 6 [Praya dubia]
MTSYFDHFIVIYNFFTDSFIITGLVILTYLLINYNYFIIPNKIQNIFEIILEHWVSIVKENLDLDNNTFFYYLTLFLFILGVNLFGFFLHTFPLTTHLSITFGMSFGIWLGIIFLGIKNFKIYYLSMFMPSGSPLILSPFLVLIEIISNISRPIALGMRLAANLTAGHILLAILANFGYELLVYTWSFVNILSLFIILMMTLLEIGVLIIQAYVFVLLLIIYLKDSLVLH